MRAASGQVAAIDLGATSGRVMVADIAPGRIELEQAARFANTPVHLFDGSRTALHWDLPGLFGAACAGLAEAGRHSDRLVGIGVDSWAVDYGLMRNGRLLGVPHHYRDPRSASGVEAVHEIIEPADLYRRNGLQFLPFTTVYQLAADHAAGLLDIADSALLIPDLIGYWLTGERATERTNASTTGLLGVDGSWDRSLTRQLSLPDNLFPDLTEPGRPLGGVLPEIATPLGLPSSVSVTTVASHDTASAIAAIPMDPDSSAYISCGTWGLVGVETTAPVLSEAAREANFTNEVGVENTTRFLRNVMGLWLLSETVRRFRRDGMRADLDELLAGAASVSEPVEVFDTDDPMFLAPGNMPERIGRWYRDRGLRAPRGPAELVRAIVDSLAAAFAETVRVAAELSGTGVDRIHLVGGGAQNRLLCQLTADRSGLPVLAGPVEATALGNVLLTARAHGLLDGELHALREFVARNVSVQRFLPRVGTAPSFDLAGA